MPETETVIHVHVDEPPPIIPNAETVAALEAAERGEMKTFATIEALFADLHSDDAENP